MKLGPAPSEGRTSRRRLVELVTDLLRQAGVEDLEPAIDLLQGKGGLFSSRLPLRLRF